MVIFVPVLCDLFVQSSIPWGVVALVLLCFSILTILVGRVLNTMQARIHIVVMSVLSLVLMSIMIAIIAVEGYQGMKITTNSDLKNLIYFDPLKKV